MSTQIKRLQQAGSDFVPITLSEAVVVNCNNIPGLASLGITTLERVLRALLGIAGTNAGDIAELEKLVTEINNVLSNKQDKLIPGNGIEILPNGTINATFSTTLYVIESSLPQPPSVEHLNKIYLIPGEQGQVPNVFTEYICVQQNDAFYWEQIGSVSSEIDLADYLKIDAFYNYVNTVSIQAVDVKTSEATGNQLVSLDYEIPETLYDYLIQ